MIFADLAPLIGLDPDLIVVFRSLEVQPKYVGSYVGEGCP